MAGNARHGAGEFQLGKRIAADRHRLRDAHFRHVHLVHPADHGQPLHVANGEHALALTDRFALAQHAVAAAARLRLQHHAGDGRFDGGLAEHLLQAGDAHPGVVALQPRHLPRFLVAFGEHGLVILLQRFVVQSLASILALRGVVLRGGNDALLQQRRALLHFATLIVQGEFGLAELPAHARGFRIVLPVRHRLELALGANQRGLRPAQFGFHLGGVQVDQQLSRVHPFAVAEVDLGNLALHRAGHMHFALRRHATEQGDGGSETLRLDDDGVEIVARGGRRFGGSCRRRAADVPSGEAHRKEQDDDEHGGHHARHLHLAQRRRERFVVLLEIAIGGLQLLVLRFQLLR